MPTGQFTAGAWIVGSRMRHHRTHDHFGTEVDSVITLSSPIGKYPAGMTVDLVLADMVTRLTGLESGTHRVFTFTSSAFIQPVLRANAVILKTRSVTFTADAVLGHVWPITLDAMFTLPRSGSFTIDAILV